MIRLLPLAVDIWSIIAILFTVLFVSIITLTDYTTVSHFVEHFILKRYSPTVNLIQHYYSRICFQRSCFRMTISWQVLVKFLTHFCYYPLEICEIGLNYSVHKKDTSLTEAGSHYLKRQNSRKLKFWVKERFLILERRIYTDNKISSLWS